MLGVFVLLAGCGDDSSDFDGAYETVSLTKQVDGCGGQGAEEPIPDTIHWFRLDLVETELGALLAYYACQDLGVCLAEYDLYRSFGKGPDGWLTTVATAIDPGCTLQYRERTLSSIDDTTILIDDRLYREVDPSLSGDACAIEEARMRGTAMPCTEQTLTIAERR
jgi:hypothetical protein